MRGHYVVLFFQGCGVHEPSLIYVRFGFLCLPGLAQQNSVFDNFSFHIYASVF